MSWESYMKQAHERHNEVWNLAMKRQMDRRLFMKSSTIAALGGAAAVNGLLAACAGGEEQTIEEVLTEGYEYSRYPTIDKYHWKRLEWGGTPYVDGTLTNYGGGWSHYDVVNSVKSSGGAYWQNLMHTQYGAGASMELLKMVPALADKVTHAPDYSYYDYHITPNTYFHDVPPVNGRRLTAEDVKYSLDVYRTTGVYPPTLAFLDRIEVLPDGETVRVHVKKPIIWLNYLLGASNYWVFAKEHFEGDKDRWKQQPIGSGPFMVTETKYRSSLEAVRHEKFSLRDDRWKGYKLPFLKGQQSTYIADVAARKSAFRTGQIDYYITIGDYTGFNDLLATNKPDTRVQIMAPYSAYGPHAWYMRNDKKPFSDIRVRRAMNMALDRQALADTAYGGFASAQHPIGYNFLGRTDPFAFEELPEWQQYNPTRAKELLTEAGYPNGFEMEFLSVTPVADNHLLTAKYLEDVGIRVKFDPQESAVYAAVANERNYKDAIQGFYPSAMTGVKVAREMFLPDSMQNRSYVDDPVMTDLVDKVTYTLDADEQLKLLNQINTRALDQCYALERVTAFIWTMWQPWFKNASDATSGWFCCYGNWQWAINWIDDTAPGGRGGHLKA